ncbi:MAG TPA: glucose-1-phosphate thymidylyltransferase [Planctomycetaceae bacterium]|nr:glucose-1-phosphate thymidylyltransferase [Planctomycetaceae bacterium]|tara:strand:+ start:29627 stop:30520 length:894 start_codon:yes stop_codon:yes gene_type:complete
MTETTSCKKGIILAGGTGSRLYPLTRVISKQLLPIYDKPMIYYPLSTLMLAGVRDLLIISSPQDIGHFQSLLGSGEQLGISIRYAVQEKPEGLAQSFIVGREFIGNDPVALVLGDNIFYGQGFRSMLRRAASQSSGATVFGYPVKDPERYGVVAFNEQGEPTELVEKPVAPPSNYAVPGLYFYDNQVVEIASNLQPSARGEYEITDVNKEYLSRGELRVELFTRGFAWLDTGTHETLIQAGDFVQTIEQRQGLKIACIEEIAYLMGYIDREQLASLAQQIPNQYGQYLKEIVARESN